LATSETKLRDRFLSQNQERLYAARQQADLTNTQLMQLQVQHIVILVAHLLTFWQWLDLNKDTSWWRQVIEVASSSTGLLDRIKNDLAGHQQVVPSVADRFTDYSGLVFTISQLLEELALARGAAYAELTKVCLDNPPHQVRKARPLSHWHQLLSL